MTDQELNEWLLEHGALSWVWPDSRNRFDTGLPTRGRAHPNAHKCNFTPLPGCANKRHKRRQRALSNRSGRERATGKFAKFGKQA